MSLYRTLWFAVKRTNMVIKYLSDFFQNIWLRSLSFHFSAQRLTSFSLSLCFCVFACVFVCLCLSLFRVNACLCPSLSLNACLCLSSLSYMNACLCLYVSLSLLSHFYNKFYPWKLAPSTYYLYTEVIFSPFNQLTYAKDAGTRFLWDVSLPLAT